jgi:hypothetical protein
VEEIECDGLLIDTYHKTIGKGLLDYYNLDQLAEWVRLLHTSGKEAWIAGSVTIDEMPTTWTTGVDVVCVRGAACEPGGGAGRFGEVSSLLVRDLVDSIHG